MNNVQNHEMQEPLISKVISAQTSTGEGLQAAKFIHEKVFRQKEKKQSLNWFHLKGNLALEQMAQMTLLASSYLPERIDFEFFREPIHLSNARLWPTGHIISQ